MTRGVFGATVLIGLALCLGAGRVHETSAEWYVAGQFGVNFADRLTDVTGTNGFAGASAPDFDLKNPFTDGGKLGYFPGNGWFGVELDAFHTTPHIKNLDNVPGIHMRVTSAGVATDSSATNGMWHCSTSQRRPSTSSAGLSSSAIERSRSSMRRRARADSDAVQPRLPSM